MSGTNPAHKVRASEWHQWIMLAWRTFSSVDADVDGKNLTMLRWALVYFRQRGLNEGQNEFVGLLLDVIDARLRAAPRRLAKRPRIVVGSELSQGAVPVTEKVAAAVVADTSTQ